MTTTSIEDEVLGTEVLPFTGAETGTMALLAVALLATGILTLVIMRGLSDWEDD